MSLYEKNGQLFLAGMFWQVPDEGKSKVDLSRIVKHTSHNYYCRIKKIHPTYGFASDVGLPKKKKVSSLGHFIVECSNVDEKTPNSIIVYKFKEQGEPTSIETGELADNDQFGYIVFMNGTICPDDGEFISDALSIRLSVLKKIKKYEIKRLDLTLDAAEALFNIFERLEITFNNPEMMVRLLERANKEDRWQLSNLIKQSKNMDKYLPFLQKLGSDDLSESFDLQLVRNFIREPIFRDAKDNSRDAKDDLVYLVEKINIAPLTSDQVYWNNKNYKRNCLKSQLKPIAGVKNGKIKYVAGMGLIAFSIYFTFFRGEEEIQRVITPPPPKIVAVPATPAQLIKSCVVPNDKYFTDLDDWTLTGINCNSLGYSLTFIADSDTTLAELIKLTGDKNAILSGKVGTTTRKFQLAPGRKSTLQRQEIITELQRNAIEYSMKLQLPATSKDNKFSITTKLSPVYLYNQGLLNNVRLSEINMSYDTQSGYYNWTIRGEI